MNIRLTRLSQPTSMYAAACFVSGKMTRRDKNRIPAEKKQCESVFNVYKLLL